MGDSLRGSANRIVFLHVNCRSQTLSVLNRKALLITETELKLIAAAAIMGLRSSPNTG